MTRHITQRVLVLCCAAILVAGCQKKNGPTPAQKTAKDSMHVADSSHPVSDSSHQAADTNQAQASTSPASDTSAAGAATTSTPATGAATTGAAATGSPTAAGGQAASDSAQPTNDASQGATDSAQQLADTSGKTADTTKAKPVVLSYEQYEGKVLFTRYCVVCHGDLGKGDGFNSFYLDPKPEDLSDPKIMKPITDERLRQVIRDGGRGVNKSPLMPSWGGRMTKNDIIFVAAYVRMLSEPNP